MPRVFLLITFLILAAGAFSQTRKPNIIIIYADDMGYGEIGAYGQQRIQTPFLNQMAAKGMRFTRHYSSSPVCAPSRCALLTGKHTGQSYIRGNYELGGFADSLEGGQMPLHEGIITFPALLQKAGYTTGLFGKWGLGMPQNGGSPLLHGFDEYYGYLDQKQAHNYYPTHLWHNDMVEVLNNPVITVHTKLEPASVVNEETMRLFKGNDYAPDKIVEAALLFLNKNQLKPFFLYLPLTIPHVSLQLPEKYRQVYQGLFPEQPYLGQRGYAPQQFPMSTYAGMISYLDQQVGRILEELQKLKLDSNTLVIFSSDNGPSNAGGAATDFFNSSGGLRGQKMDLYEGGIRVPFLALWPGNIPSGKSNSSVTAQYDMLATIAELTGLQAPPGNGISFAQTLLGKTNAVSGHEYLYFEYPENGGQLAVILGNWKAIKRGIRKNHEAPWQLYDLVTDEREQNDQAANHPEILQRCNDIVKKEHRCSHLNDWEFLHPKL